jgi:hypothetical protein
LRQTRMKQQFYISDDDADRCKKAFRLRKPISVRGIDILDRQVKRHTGVVLSGQYSSFGAPGEKWRITIDTDGRMVPRTHP